MDNTSFNYVFGCCFFQIKQTADQHDKWNSLTNDMTYYTRNVRSILQHFRWRDNDAFWL